ncbi:MAG: hypothetical protein U1C74_00455 [Phenylobacterium sp.]|nr:hypothetical protein [Phenylobacterium sp.]
MSRITPIVVGGVGILLSGCAGVPKMEFVGPTHSKSDPVAPSEILVRHLLCEIQEASTFKDMVKLKYVAVINLNLTAEDNLGLSPTLNFITPKAVAATSDTAILGGEISRKRERYFAQDLEFSLADLEALDVCSKGLPGGALRGDLGVKELMERRSTFGVPNGTKPTKRDDLGFDALHPSVQKFGTTAKFTVKWGAAAGPHQVRVHFKGPSDKGLLSTSRVDVSSLAVAFSRTKEPGPGFKEVIAELKRLGAAPGLVEPGPPSPAPVQPPSDKSASEARAADEARSLINQMILQNLTISPR